MISSHALVEDRRAAPAPASPTTLDAASPPDEAEPARDSEPPISGDAPSNRAAYEGSFDPATDASWQRLWLATRRREWTMLAVVPISPDTPALRAATALAAVGRHHLGQPVDVVDATGTDLASLQGVLDDLGERKSGARTTVVAVAAAIASPVAAALARAADVALLALRFGDLLADADETIEDVGVDRFVGSVLLSGAKEAR